MGISTLTGGFAIIFWMQYADYSAFPGWAIARITVVGMMGLVTVTVKLLQERRSYKDNQRKSDMRRPGPKPDTSDDSRSHTQTTVSDLDSSQNYSQLTPEPNASHTTYLTLDPGQENTPYSQLTPDDHERQDQNSQLTFDKTATEQTFTRL